MLDKTGAGCAFGGSLGDAVSARDKAIRENPNAPVITYKYRVYGSDEVGGSHCVIIYREAKGEEINVSGDTTAKGVTPAKVALREYGFNLRNGYDYGNFSWGAEFAVLFGSYKISQYPINYFDPVSQTYYDRTSKYSKNYAVMPLEVLTTFSPEYLYGVGLFGNVGVNLGTIDDVKYSYGFSYSAGLGEYWLLQAKIRKGTYTAKFIGEKATIDESLMSVGLSYLFDKE